MFKIDNGTLPSVLAMDSDVCLGQLKGLYLDSNNQY